MATNEMEQILNRIAAGFSARPWDFRKRLLELLPLLEAGQAMRDMAKVPAETDESWDTAKAALLANRKGG